MANHTNWLNISSMSGSSGQTILTLSANTNLASNDKVAIVKAYNPVYNISATTTVRLSAYEPYIYVNPSILGVPGSGGTYEFSISSNCSYVIAFPDLVTSYSTSAGTGNTNITFTVSGTSAETTLVGNIVITDDSGQYSKIVRVEQYGGGAELQYYPMNLYFDASGGSLTFTVSANCVYTISTTADWLAIDKMSGYTGITTFTVTVGENRGSEKNGVIVIVGPGSAGGIVLANQEESEQRLIVGYYVTSTTEPTKILNNSGSFSKAEYPDGTEITLGTGYTFPSTGMQYVYYTLTGNTLNNGDFNMCSQIETVSIPYGVTEIGNESSDYEFNNCTSLSSITIPDTLQKIGGNTFYNCSGLSGTFDVPQGVTYIGESAFSHTNISTFVFTSLVPPTLGTEALSSDTLYEIIVPCEVVDAYLSAWPEYVAYIVCPTYDIPYTADTSTIPSTGATRTIVLDISELVESSITIDIEGSTGVSYSYENGVITLYFSENTGPERDFTINISGVTQTGRPAKAEVYYKQRTGRQYLLSQPLTFNIVEPGKIVWANSNSAYTYDKTIQYKKNDGEWTNITSRLTGTSAASITVVEGDIVQFRADNNAYADLNNYYCSFCDSTAKFEAYGNIMSLLNSTGFSGMTTLPADYTFGHLFSTCSGLTDAVDLILPATGLKTSCYWMMFYGCSNMAAAPELPATVLAVACYENMFTGCRKLLEAPELPATTLTVNCYSVMFGGCSGLVTAPELPATELATRCYEHMLYDCTSLITAPELPATTLAYACYLHMFGGCTSLTTAPELPATTLTPYCYEEMFLNCTSLTTAPTLPAKTLSLACYSGMFSGCSNLNYIECLATDISASNCTYKWVNGVASSGTFVKVPYVTAWTIGINGIPTNWVVDDCEMVWLSEKAIGLPESLSSEEITVYANTNWTARTTDDWIILSQTTGSSGETIVTVNVVSTTGPREGTVQFYSLNNEETLNVIQNNTMAAPLTFKILSDGYISFKADSTSMIKSIQYKINGGEWTNTTSWTGSGRQFSVVSGDTIQFRGNNDNYRYNRFSSSCKFNVEGCIMSLIKSTDFLSETALTTDYTFYQLFYGCAITDASKLGLPATTLTSHCYREMFRGCSSLTTAPALPATTLANACYYGMFSGCGKLTKTPTLQATELASNCYNGMFSGCTSLTTSPVLLVKTLEYGCYSNMFNGCTNLNYVVCVATDISESYCTNHWLSGVSSSGTFVKAPSMTSWTTGTSGIPTGWTVQDAT